MDDIERMYEQFASNAKSDAPLLDAPPQPDPDFLAAPASIVVAEPLPYRLPAFPIELWPLMVVGLTVFLIGIRWGLPSANSDPFLFGSHPVRDGAQIAQLAGDRTNQNAAADVDANPHIAGDTPITLNATDADRAEIARRYRLFTYQPDEMITLMALARMHPSRSEFDPGLYQYGGLWIYPVGGIIKLAGVTGLLKVVADPAFYLDHPDEFANFYVAARVYVVLWGLVGIWAVYRIVQTSAAGRLASIVAALLFICTPVVVDQSHQAKPHLPGVVIVLLAMLAARRYVAIGERCWWIIASMLCGAAMGMVLTGVIALIVIPPAMLATQRLSVKRYAALLAGAWGIGIAVYFITNPYVFIHLIAGGGVLTSNLANSQSMYHPFASPLRSLATAARLLGEGAGPLAAVFGIVAAIGLCWRDEDSRLTPIRLLLLLTAIVLIQFITFAAEKPGEYARFAILPDVVLGMACCIFIGRMRLRTFERAESLSLLLLLTALPASIYLVNFVADGRAVPRRIADARLLESIHAAGAASLGVFDDPAPYSMPAIDLFEWKLMKLPRAFDLSSGDTPVDVIVRPVDRATPAGARLGGYEQVGDRSLVDLFPSRISWANKPMSIWVRRSLLDRENSLSE